MANQETQKIDNIIASRRAMLLGGGAALAALAMPSSAKAANAVTSYTDNDILNFALNLEYLEANFYYLAAFGTTINVPNAASIAAGGPSAGIGIGAGTATTGIAPTTGSGTIVPFAVPAVKAYAVETAIEEGKHVVFLRSTLGPAAVAQPALDISPAGAFTAVANLAGITGSFNPYSSDVNFLVGAYIFEDVGVTAYKGAAPLISQTSTGKAYLQAAASILAVEAYHAGLIRTTIYNSDALNTNGYLTLTQKISNLRSSASHAANSASPVQDDFGLYPNTYPATGATPPGTQLVQLAGAAGVTATNIADADPTNVIAFSRNTTQVLNIVTGGMATGTGTAKGGFFPSGMNGLFS